MKTPSLKESLERWTCPRKLPHPFDPQKTRKAAAEAAAVLGDVESRKPSHYDLATLHLRITESWRQSRTLSEIKPRDLRRLPWVLFYPPKQKHTAWLGAEPRVLEAYRRWLIDRPRTRPVLALLHEFLRVYPVGLRTFGDLRKMLYGSVNDGSSPPPSLQKWRKRCLDWELLRMGGDRSFVQNLVSSSDAIDDILCRAGLNGGLAQCGFLNSGIRAYLRHAESLLIQNRLNAADLDRLLTLLEFEGKLRFDDTAMRTVVATALLRPFIESQPDPATRERMQPFFLRHYRDPRLGSGRHKWSVIPDEIRRVVIRWLVERALEQFFLLVEETALDRHWRYREAFWRAFHREGFIEDICFVLGPRAKDFLRKTSEKSEEAETSANLQGAQGDQSVLVLRMPGVTIAEWSHNGSCRMWLDNNPDSPRFYESTYLRNDLIGGADFRQAHHGSDRGSWQDKIAQWLHDNTGVEIARSEYFPDRLRKRETNRYLNATTSTRSSRSQAATASRGGRQPQTNRKQSAASALSELQRVRAAVRASHKSRVDLRAFMKPTSPAWAAYVEDHGVPGYGTRWRTVLRQLNSTIERLNERPGISSNWST